MNYEKKIANELEKIRKSLQFIALALRKMSGIVEDDSTEDDLPWESPQD